MWNTQSNILNVAGRQNLYVIERDTLPCSFLGAKLRKQKR